MNIEKRPGEEDLDYITRVMDAHGYEKEREFRVRCLRLSKATLTEMHDIMVDYDGCNTVESLKELIDELRADLNGVASMLSNIYEGHIH